MRPLVVLAALALLAPGRASSQVGTAVITGTIREAGSGRAIGAARVLLGGTLLVQQTDSGGRFRFAGLPAGAYHLRAASLGYRSDTLAITLADGERREVGLSLVPQALELTDLVVTASRRVERIEEAQVSVGTVSRTEVLERNVSQVREALAFVPGVTFNGEDQMDIRGSTGWARGVGSRVLVLLDGHPAISADGGEIIWESLPLLDLEQTEILKGASSALYGSNALGGVVNMLTSRIGERPTTTARMYAGLYTPQSVYDFTSSTLSGQGVTLQHSRRLGSVGARVGLSRDWSDGFTQNGRYDRWAGRAKLNSSQEASHPWDVYAVWSRGDQDEFFVWRASDAPYEVKPDEIGDRSVVTQVLTGATVTPVVRSNLMLRVSPYLNFNSNDNDFHDNQDWRKATKGGATVALSLEPGGGSHSATMGVEGAYTAVRSSFAGDPGITDLALFVQDEIRFGDRVRATLGARLDSHSATGAESELSVNPKLSAVYLPSDRLSLRASVARGYRAPAAVEQFVSTVQYGIEVIPNPDLVGERAWSGEVGATAFPRRNIRVEGAVFLSDYDDLIGPGIAPGEIFVFQFQNVSEARIKGLDLGVKTSFAHEMVELQGSYLYLDSEDLETGKALPYRSRHNVTGTLSLFKGLFGADLRFRSRVEEVLAYPADPRAEITTLDLRGAYKVGVVAVQAKIRNVFNTFYTDVRERNPGAPRSFGLTLFTEF